MDAFKKFIVVGHARSGSTLLIEGLRQHPEADVFGEIFHPDEQERKTNACAGRDRTRLYQEGQNAVEFVQNEVFFARGDNCRAVGFKTFYHYIEHQGENRRFWDYVRSCPEISIIHLFRENLLEAAISHARAFASRKWSRLPHEEERSGEIGPINLDPRDLERVFWQILTARSVFGREFRERDYLELEYSQAFGTESQFHDTMSSIFRFLCLSDKTVRPVTVKLSRQKLSEQIGNYEELRRYFLGSFYQKFFVT